MGAPTFRKGIGDWQVSLIGLRSLNHPAGASEAAKVQLTYAPKACVINGAVVDQQPQTWTYIQGSYQWANSQRIEDLTITFLAFLAEVPEMWEGPQLSPQALESLSDAIGTDLCLALNPPGA